MDTTCFAIEVFVFASVDVSPSKICLFVIGARSQEPFDGAFAGLGATGGYFKDIYQSYSLGLKVFWLRLREH